MSGQRVRKRVEEEERAEEAWSLEDYEWDPINCVAPKKRMRAPGEPRAEASAPLGVLQHVAVEEGITQAAAANPRLASLPVLETVDRTDAEPATVCEVIGCGASLAGLKRYYVRMRVCERHLHAPAIVVNGVVSRFCQQCARFQFVGEFSGNKKSCAATLERHNARHRAKVLARMQDLDDGDSDAAAAGSRRTKAKPKAAAVARRKAASQRPAAAAASAAAAGAAADHASPDTSGAGQPDWFLPRLPEKPRLAFPALPLAGQPTTGLHQQLGTALGGGGAMGPWQGQGKTAPPPSGAQALSAGAPVLPAEAAAPCKPASPQLALDAWDGGSSCFLEGAPRPLVTTGGNGVVSTGDRAPSTTPASALPGVTAAAHVRPQAHSTSMPSTWPLQSLPYDVRSGLAAVQGQLLDMPRGVALAAGDMPYTGGNYAVSGAWKPARDCLPVVPVPPHRRGAISGGSTPSVSNALAASGGDVSAAKRSQATARQAVQAAGVGGALADAGALAGDAARVYGSDGLPVAGTTHSGGSFQAEAEPCGSSSRVATNVAASPVYSQDEDGVSATRVSASGAGLCGADGGTDATPRLQPGDVAARISCIMEELCPLIEQFKQGVAHGSPHGLYDGAASGAGAAPRDQAHASDNAETLTVAAASLPPPLQAAGVCGQAARDREGFSSLPPLVDTAIAMMQTASQLAASLQQACSAPAGANAPPPPPPQQQQQHVWTVTSGFPALFSQPVGTPGLEALSLQSSDLVGCTSSQQRPLMPQLRQPPSGPYHPPGWRSLASHPGVVVNEAAAQRAVAAAMPMATWPVSPPPVALPIGHAGPGPAVCVSSMSTTTSAAVTKRGGGGGGIGSGFLVGEGALLSQQGYVEAHVQFHGDGEGVPPVACVAGGVSGDVDSDDDMFQQLLTILQDDAAGEEFTAASLQQQQQQQQLFHGIASAAQQAVTVHQHVVHAMPYGHVPATPFYWPAQVQAAAGVAPADIAPPSVSLAAPHLPHPHRHTQASLPQYLQSHPHIQSPFGWPNLAAAPGGAPAALFAEEPDDVDPRELTRVSLKAMNVLPHELPSNLRSNLRRWLKEARAEALQATLRPGCLQLVVDVLRPPSAAEMCSVLIPGNDADQAAADVFRVLGQRLRDTYVQVDRRVLQMRVGERPVVLSWEDAAHDGGLDGAKYPTLCGCSAAAVCAGSDAVLQLTGSHLSHPGTKVFARIRGRDLQAALLPPTATATAGGQSPPGAAAADSSRRMTVAVPPSCAGLMAVEVGVGHLLGDWWPVLVLPPGCEGVAAEVRQLQADAEAATAAAAAGRALRRLLIDLAGVLEVYTDAAAADASAAAAADAAVAAAAAATNAPQAQPRSSGGGAAGPGGARSTGGAATASVAVAPAPPEGLCPSPGGGDTGTRVSHSDAGFTAISAGSWSCAGRTDTLMSSHAGSTLGSFMTISSALASPSTAMAAGQTHTLTARHAQHVAAATAGSLPAAAAGNVSSAAAPVAAAPQFALLPPPPTATLRRGLNCAARLLRFAIARGLPHLTALMLAAANCLARAPGGERRPPSTPSTQQSQPAAQAQAPLRSGRADLLAAAGVDLQALLPLAVLSGSTATVDRLAAFAARVLGSPLRLDLPQGPGGLSALHLASLLPDGGTLACHLISTQPWAAWEWLSLGWTPPGPLLAAASQGTDSTAAENGAAVAKTAGKVADGKGNGQDLEVGEEGEEGEEEEEEEEEDQEVVLRPGGGAPPLPPQLTPGQLSVLLGANTAVLRVVDVLVAAQHGGNGASSAGGPSAAGESVAPAAAVLVGAVEAWGRTGVALLEALCTQLAAQRI